MDRALLAQRLEQRLAELQGRLESLRRDLRQPHSADFAEQAQERENEEVEGAIGLETEHSIREVRQALLRLEEGVYGECQSCGATIPDARLAARPETTLCVSCAS